MFEQNTGTTPHWTRFLNKIFEYVWTLYVEIKVTSKAEEPMKRLIWQNLCWVPRQDCGRVPILENWQWKSLSFLLADVLVACQNVEIQIKGEEFGDEI